MKVLASVIALIASTLGIASQMPASASRTLTATFIGNEAWHVTDGEYVLLTDFPYESGYSRYMTWDWASVPKIDGAKTLLVITHEHRDHFAAEFVARVKPAGVIGPAKTRAAAAGALALMPGKAVRFGPMTVQSIPTPHAKLEHYSHVIDWDGVRFYLPGDTEEPDSLLQARNLDVAFVTPWMLNAIRSRGGRIDAKRVIVVHHEASEVVTPYAGAIVPRQGQTFTFDRSRER